MSLRIRGQETTLRFQIDGVAKISGTWLKTKDFDLSPRTDIVEQGYLGESEDDLQIQHNGYDFSFSVDNEDAETIDFLQELAEREANGLSPQQVSLTVIYNYREGAGVKAQSFRDVVMKVDSHGAGGRTEYVSTSFSGKCKRADVISA